MKTEIYNTDEMDLAEFLDEVEGRNPIYIYTYDDYVMVSDVEVDEDDLETLFENKISELEEDLEEI